MSKRKSLQEPNLNEAEGSASKKVAGPRTQSTDWENVVENMKEDFGKLLNDKKTNYDTLKLKESMLENVISEKTSLILALDFESETNSISYDIKMIEILENEVRLDKEIRELQVRQIDLSQLKRDLEKEKERCINEHHLENLTNSISYDFKMIEILENEVRLDKEIRELQARQIDLSQLKRDLEKEKERCINEHHLENLDVRDNRDELEEEVKSLRFKRSNVKWKLKRFRQISLGNDDKKKTLQRFIHKKITALECPVCLEEAVSPIFSCIEMHIICCFCLDKVEGNTNRCPVCRASYGKKRMRHRFAERDSEELMQMRNELKDLD